MATKNKITIIGAGFSGLSAAIKLCQNPNNDIIIVEADSELGGLAGGFEHNNIKLEKFYHHWFSNDKHIDDLVSILGTKNNIIQKPTKTGMYYANNFYKLSNPIDLLKFKAISFYARIRLGVSTLYVRAIKNWKKIENITAYEWLERICGKEAFNVVWKPLLEGKFGPYAKEVGAVWFWKKLALRGSSRSKDGREILQYYKGGFYKLAQEMADYINNYSGKIHLNTSVKYIQKLDTGYNITTETGEFKTDVILFTTAPEIVAKISNNLFSNEFITRLNRVKYLANKCLVLELDRSLSDIYWLNVNDPNFPFVGIIEHTNFDNPVNYNNSHIVYLSKYLPHTDELYNLTDAEYYKYVIPYVKKMFPEFEDSWVKSYTVWKARFAQPVMERNFSSFIPPKKSPMPNIYMINMAQIYPEDRGTNYAIRDGFNIAEQINSDLKKV